MKIDDYWGVKEGIRIDSGRWKWKLNIHKVLRKYEDDDDEKLVEQCAKELYQLLKRNMHIINDDDLKDAIEQLQYATTYDEINGFLEDLYDYADEKRIWLG